MLFYLFNFLLTTLQSQLLSSLSVKVPSTESTVGTESERNCSFILSDFATATFTVNAESAKCIKHSKEYCCWTNFDRCLLTNFVQLLSLPWGNDVLRHILCVDFLCNFFPFANQQHNNVFIDAFYSEFCVLAIFLLAVYFIFY